VPLLPQDCLLSCALMKCEFSNNHGIHSLYFRLASMTLFRSYSVRYRAAYLPTAAGVHTFSITHRESVKLWVDGVSLIDSLSSTGASVTVTGTISLPLANA
jgi:hypothetical protein